MRFRITATKLIVISVIGCLVGIASPAIAAVFAPVPGDPLTGSGDVTRTQLTAADLTTGTSGGTVTNDAFALPSAAKAPLNKFEGTLELTGVAALGGFNSLKDPYNYSSFVELKHLPPFAATLVQNGSHLFPADRGIQYTGSSYWNLEIQPGRAWNENADGTKTRAALPFALIERNANCVHNGVITFLFDASTVSQVRYQVTSETCEYFQFDMWGQVPGLYRPGVVAGGDTIRSDYAAEVSNRLPTKSITSLASDYPGAGIDAGAFTRGITPSALSTFGFYYRGVNYVGGCQTRQGNYPFCGQMLLPSYSTAKSAFAGLALMDLGQRYGLSIYAQPISRYVSETAGVSAWSGVTFQNTLNMATGNYNSLDFEADEAGTTMTNFFLAEPYTQKMSIALGFPRKSTPGTQWAYHSSDTFVVTRAMNNYLWAQGGSGQDIFSMVNNDVFAPIKLGKDVQTTARTDNSSTGSPFGGYGLFWTQDDIAKVSKFLTVDHGGVNGTQLLNPQMLDDSMQRNPNNRGVDTPGTTSFKYNNGFWAKRFTNTDNAAFTTPFYVPFMSGFGGITVALMPNGASYYVFSDNDEFGWSKVVVEANKLAPMVEKGRSGCSGHCHHS